MVRGLSLSVVSLDTKLTQVAAAHVTVLHCSLCVGAKVTSWHLQRYKSYSRGSYSIQESGLSINYSVKGYLSKIHVHEALAKVEILKWFTVEKPFSNKHA